MSFPDQSVPQPSFRHHGRPCRGSIVIEVGLSLLIFLFAVTIAVSAIGKIRQRARCDRFADDLRVFSAAFQNYHRQRGAWPLASNGTVAIPLGMERDLRETPWLKQTPLGGNYTWIVPYPVASSSGAGTSPHGAIGATAFSPNAPLAVSSADLAYIDATLDDGNLATGNFRTGFNGWPVYLIKP